MYAWGQMPIVCKGFVSNSCLRIPLYSVWASEGVSKCRRLIQTGGYALAHLSPFFENISPNKFRSDIFSNCETSQSPCCGERGLSDQWRMWPLLFLQTRGNPETHKVALPPHQTRAHHKKQKSSKTVLDCKGFVKCLPHSSSTQDHHHEKWKQLGVPNCLIVKYALPCLHLLGGVFHLLDHHQKCGTRKVHQHQHTKHRALNSPQILP